MRDTCVTMDTTLCGKVWILITGKLVYGIRTYSSRYVGTGQDAVPPRLQKRRRVFPIAWALVQITGTIMDGLGLTSKWPLPGGLGVS